MARKNRSKKAEENTKNTCLFVLAIALMAVSVIVVGCL